MQLFRIFVLFEMKPLGRKQGKHWRRRGRGEGEASDNEGKKNLQEASEGGRREGKRKKAGDTIEIADMNPFSLPSRRWGKQPLMRGVAEGQNGKEEKERRHRGMTESDTPHIQ